ncbi:MAG: TonB-dependent receptor [Gemmatimonadota bacterium]|nr:MAG: TonB-dependent receptor [Gemmatimonadota bacterium]
MTALCLALLLIQSVASLHGTVRDSETGTPVRGASVELLDGSRRSLTDEAGYYSLRDIPAGPRHVKVSGLGYRSRTLHVFVPAEGGIQVDVALLPEPIPLQPVEANVDRSERRTAELGDRAPRVGSTTVTYYDVRANPGLAQPDFFEALAGGSVHVDPESPNGLHVRGGSGDQNLFTLDGIPILSPYHATGQFSAFAADALSRIDLHAGVPPAAFDGALSSVVDVRTRSPNRNRLEFRGAVTPIAARLTADGPAVLGGGFLVSGGWGRPGFLAPPDESSYVRGSFEHGLLKGEWPLAAGRLSVVGFRSDNTLRLASVPTETDEDLGPALDTPPPPPGAAALQNRFAWTSNSFGVGWQRPIGSRAILETRAWYAGLDVATEWWAADDPLGMSSRRSSLGTRLQLTVDGDATRSLLGLSLERERTAYDVEPMVSSCASGVTCAFELSARPTVLAGFAEHQRVLTRRIQVLVGLRGNQVLGERLYLAPRASLRWMLSPTLSASAGYARTNQWIQSLRNTESLIDNFLSPDLSVGVGSDDVPVASADQFTLAIDGQPAVGLQMGLEAYVRAMDGVVLVAPGTGQPFAVEGFSVGSAEIWGMAVSLDVKRARYRALASYGLAGVAYEVRQREYRPDFAIGQTISAAFALYPSAQLELRSALRAEIGRPTTAMEGPFVWEACSIIEGGCEAEGSPQRTSGRLGDDRLPPYVRLDLGVRKHWHSRVFGRDGEVAVFATLSNVFGRKNVLGYVSDPDSGELSELPMRPFSPLTAGLEWRF